MSISLGELGWLPDGLKKGHSAVKKLPSQHHADYRWNAQRLSLTVHLEPFHSATTHERFSKITKNSQVLKWRWPFFAHLHFNTWLFFVIFEKRSCVVAAEWKDVKSSLIWPSLIHFPGWFLVCQMDAEAVVFFWGKNRLAVWLAGLCCWLFCFFQLCW